MRIIVTGATGFVGFWLIKRLTALLPPAAKVFTTGHGAANGTSSHTLDITDPAATDQLIQTVRPTAVIHLAAISSFQEARQDVDHAWAVNLHGTRNLANAVLRHTPRARFIFAGSSEEYGASFNKIDGALDETAPLAPRNVYASTKAAADLMLGQMAEDGLQSVRFRPFNHTGPNQSTRFVVPAFAAQIAAIERGEHAPVIMVGNLQARRDFLDVRDVVNAYSLAVLAETLEPGQILNLASGTAQKISDILHSLLLMSATPIEIAEDPALLRPSDTPITLGNAGRAQQLLGWAPRIPFETTLQDIMADKRHSHAGSPAYLSEGQ